MTDQLMAKFGQLQNLQGQLSKAANDLQGYLDTFTQSNTKLNAVWPADQDAAAAAYQQKAQDLSTKAAPLPDDARALAKFVGDFVQNAQTTQGSIVQGLS